MWSAKQGKVSGNFVTGLTFLAVAGEWRQLAGRVRLRNIHVSLVWELGDLCLIFHSGRLQAATPMGKHMLEHSFKRIVSGQLQQTRQKASMGGPSTEKPAGAPQAWSTGELLLAFLSVHHHLLAAGHLSLKVSC